MSERSFLIASECLLSLLPSGNYREQSVKCPREKGCAAALGAIRHPALRPQPEPVGFVFNAPHAAELAIEGKDAPHGLGLAGLITSARPSAS